MKKQLRKSILELFKHSIEQLFEKKNLNKGVLH